VTILCTSIASFERLRLLVVAAVPIVDAFDPGNSVPQHALGDLRSNPRAGMLLLIEC
jgi:hypothetical protein